MEPELLDESDNLILLCKTDHKLVDDQWATYTAEALRKIKLEHEAWIENALTVAAEPAAVERDALQASEQRLLRIEFLQESALPLRYLLLALDLQTPMQPSELGHFRALLTIERQEQSEPKSLCIGGRDSYAEYYMGGTRTLVFGQLLLVWLEPPPQVVQSTIMSFGYTSVPQLVLDADTRNLIEFSVMHELALHHASVYLTEPLWARTARISIVASDYVLASFERGQLAALKGDPLVQWPEDLSAAEREVQWRLILPKGSDYARYEREGESPDWFPDDLYRPWLLDTSDETPPRIRRRGPSA